MVDDRHMLRAIELAREWSHTHPNPRVGSVIVDRGGRVVGEGWHRGPGTDHAEVVALTMAGSAAEGSTAYVTLEPCAHHGRTPPCADALIAAGITTVVVAAIDPDPNVSGLGIERLRSAGVEVITDVLTQAAREVDPAYFRHRETGLPLVTLKWAMTLDGSVAAQDGTSRWITSDEARHDAHLLRSQVDGVVIGAATMRADDPLLDVRIEGHEGPQPRPVIISGSGELPPDARIWSRDPVVVSSTQRDLPSGQLLNVPGTEAGPDPVESCRALAGLGLIHLLLEGGPTIAGAWWRAGVVSNGVVYIGARIGGGAGRSPMSGGFAAITAATEVEFGTIAGVGRDVRVTFEKKG